MDGTLIAIERPRKNYEGFYAKDGKCGLNVQGCVDGSRRFRSISIRSGSNNDQSMWNMSYLGIHLSTLIPAGLVVLGDSGYKLCSLMMTPFLTLGGRVTLTAQQTYYNFWHARSRIVVECSFGWLKKRFPILKMPLKRGTETSQEDNVRTILCCCVLHNMLIDYGNADYRPMEQEIAHDDLMDVDDPVDYLTSSESVVRGKERRNRFMDYFNTTH